VLTIMSNINPCCTAPLEVWCRSCLFSFISQVIQGILWSRGCVAPSLHVVEILILCRRYNGAWAWTSRDMQRSCEPTLSVEVGSCYGVFKKKYWFIWGYPSSFILIGDVHRYRGWFKGTLGNYAFSCLKLMLL